MGWVGFLGRIFVLKNWLLIVYYPYFLFLLTPLFGVVVMVFSIGKKNQGSGLSGSALNVGSELSFTARVIVC